MALNVVVICGSLRKGSYNRMVANALPGLAPPELKLKDAPPFEGFPVFNQDLKDASGEPPDVIDWASAIRNADGVLIVSPEYNWSVPGGLKNAIDWVSRMKDQPFKDKPVALQSASTGPMGASRMQYHLRQVLVSIDATMFTKPEIIVTFADKKMTNGELSDQPTKDIIKTQLAAFAKFIERVKPR
ncbi:MAG: NAD(P)H-dependent oxidoreductase [Pseudolabrys sp.]|nr:NAD(P)H-dependent oxidoreductase [Pseudolabrys sp.]MBV9953761.1 NAD(P)H-dependent oxidoreductase [Pseudolabrys sp.]